MTLELIHDPGIKTSNPKVKDFDYYVEIGGINTFDEIYEWMIDNIGEPPLDWFCEVEHTQQMDHNGEYDERDFIYFWLKEEHAMAFKLRWT